MSDIPVDFEVVRWSTQLAMPDGRRWALAIYFVPAWRLSFANVLLYKPRDPSAVWAWDTPDKMPIGEFYAQWSDDAVGLGHVIDNAGGLATWILGFMFWAMRVIIANEGFNPAFTTINDLFSELSAWMLRLYNPGAPWLVLAQAK